MYNFSLQNQYNHITRKFVFTSKICFKVFLFFIQDYLLFQIVSRFFWFCIKRNQVYYTEVTYKPVLLVGIQLLFSHCVKYVEIRAFSDPCFPVCEQNRIRIFPYLGRTRISDSVQIRENTDKVLSIYGKIRIRESSYFSIFHAVSSWTFTFIT